MTAIEASDEAADWHAKANLRAVDEEIGEEGTIATAEQLRSYLALKEASEAVASRKSNG